MTNIVPFDFEGSAVRVLTKDGEPWFVLADVCRVLEISNVGNAAARLDDDEKGSIRNPDVTSLGGNPNVTIINESGLYSLILTSRKPAAKRFKKWVTAEVLPSIRKFGAYSLDGIIGHAQPAELRAEDLTPREVNAWTGYLKMVESIFGRPVAAKMYAQTPLRQLVPALEAVAPAPAPVPAPPELDGWACLGHLLGARLHERRPETVGDLVQRARRDAKMREQLGAAGVFVDPTNWKGFVGIATAHPQLQWLFSLTDWAPGWADALLSLPGARKSPNAILFPDRQRRGVLVPWEVLERVL